MVLWRCEDSFGSCEFSMPSLQCVLVMPNDVSLQQLHLHPLSSMQLHLSVQVQLQD